MHTIHARLAMAGAGFATLALATTANAAPALVLDRACVNQQQSFGVTGTGFGPGQSVRVEPFAGDLVDFTADASGSFTGRLASPLVNPNSDELVVTATEPLAPTVELATAKLLNIQPRLLILPTQVHAQRAFRLSVRGLTPGGPVYAHVRYRGRWVRNRQIGVAGAPCGTLSVKTPILRDLLKNRRGEVNFVVIQVDQSKSPSLTLRPAGTVNLLLRTPVGRRVGLSNVLLKLQTKGFRDVLPTPGLIPSIRRRTIPATDSD